MRPRARMKHRPFRLPNFVFRGPPRGTCWAPVELEQSVLLTRVGSEFFKNAWPHINLPESHSALRSWFDNAECIGHSFYLLGHFNTSLQLNRTLLCFIYIKRYHQKRNEKCLQVALSRHNRLYNYQIETMTEFHAGAKDWESSLPKFLTFDLASGFVLQVFWWRRSWTMLQRGKAEDAYRWGEQLQGTF